MNLYNLYCTNTNSGLCQLSQTMAINLALFAIFALFIAL